jgi:hypothetical protein
VLVASNLLMGFLGRWCHIVVEVVGGFHTLMVVGIAGVVFGYVAEVEEVGWSCFDDVAARTEALSFAPAGEGSRRCTRALRVLFFLC